MAIEDLNVPGSWLDANGNITRAANALILLYIKKAPDGRPYNSAALTNYHPILFDYPYSRPPLSGNVVATFFSQLRCFDIYRIGKLRSSVARTTDGSVDPSKCPDCPLLGNCRIRGEFTDEGVVEIDPDTASNPLENIRQRFSRIFEFKATYRTLGLEDYDSRIGDLIAFEEAYVNDIDNPYSQDYRHEIALYVNLAYNRILLENRPANKTQGENISEAVRLFEVHGRIPFEQFAADFHLKKLAPGVYTQLKAKFVPKSDSDPSQTKKPEEFKPDPIDKFYIYNLYKRAEKIAQKGRKPDSTKTIELIALYLPESFNQAGLTKEQKIQIVRNVIEEGNGRKYLKKAV